MADRPTDAFEGQRKFKGIDRPAVDLLIVLCYG